MLKEADMTDVSIADVASFIGREVPKVLQKSSEVGSTDQALTAPEGLPLTIQHLLEKVVHWASQQEKFEVGCIV